MITKPNDPARPVSIKTSLRNDPEYCGLTKREHFAAMAMQGLLSNADLAITAIQIANWSVEQANELIESLNKK